MYGEVNGVASGWPSTVYLHALQQCLCRALLLERVVAFGWLPRVRCISDIKGGAAWKASQAAGFPECVAPCCGYPCEGHTIGRLKTSQDEHTAAATAVHTGKHCIAPKIPQQYPPISASGDVKWVALHAEHGFEHLLVLLQGRMRRSPGIRGRGRSFGGGGARSRSAPRAPGP